MKISVDLRRGVIVPFKNNCQWGSAAFESLHGRFPRNPSLAASFFFRLRIFHLFLINNLNLTMPFEMREGSVFKSIGDSLARNGLLSNTCDHLWDVNKRTCQEEQQKISPLNSLSLPFKWNLLSGNFLWHFIYYALGSVSNFWVCGWNPSVSLTV